MGLKWQGVLETLTRRMQSSKEINSREKKEQVDNV